MKTMIIEQWENEHYPLGRIKKQKLAEKSEHEIIFILNREYEIGRASCRERV